ncbi:TOTE conflict system archaeo-eukaryotic primase domain-containing protein [Alicyclobacillus ferrooxydans]|uniref:TOTE conflict system primase domain-containing protein n=1 Tax=Alicyclobacillus ferrooxydans TaxID=471514 RepID=A0A0P9CE03_9BACL|nr:hypothetical protein [Alicyclobacillus ferrooxydans]KPV43828.1 hypothetical protein AN477_10675 [Alicyclobacillus ferrooxydans]
MYKESMTVEQAQDKMITLLKGHPVQCALCDREFNRITPGHIKTHGEYLRSKKKLKWYRPKNKPTGTTTGTTKPLTDDVTDTWLSRDETLMETYERLYGGKDLLSACVTKLLELYQPHKGKWLVMDKPLFPRYASWHQVSSDNPAFVPNRLCASVLRDHLLLKCTVGVFARNQYKTHFVTWDIDAKPLADDTTWDHEEGARTATVSVTTLLRRWNLHPHVILSGRKGYHVTVFFQTRISIKAAMNLYQAILQHPLGPQMRRGLKIECLPLQRGNKLPLSINWRTERFCGFLDPFTLEALENPYQYLLEIIPDAPELLWEIEDQDLMDRKRENTILSKLIWGKDATEQAYKVGIVEPGTRHDTLVRVAAYLRNTPGLCPDSLDELVEALTEWSRGQYEEHRENIGTSWIEHLADVKRVAKYVWTHPLTAGTPRVIKITAATVHWIRAQSPVLAEQQVLVYAWFRMACVGEQFFLGYEETRKRTKLAKSTLDKAMKALKQKGVIVVVKNYYHSASGIVPSRTTMYRFADSPKPNSLQTALVTLKKDDEWDSSLWFRLLCTVFTVEELKRFYPHSYHRILRAEPLPIGRSAA